MSGYKNKQAGLTLSGLLGVAVVLIFVAILGMKLIPAYVHNSQIAQIFRSIASDPSMSSATIKDIKDSYDKRAMINSITDITSNDIEIARENGVLSLSASYQVKVPLAGNVSLVIEFNPSNLK